MDEYERWRYCVMNRMKALCPTLEMCGIQDDYKLNHRKKIFLLRQTVVILFKNFSMQNILKGKKFEFVKNKKTV